MVLILPHDKNDRLFDLRPVLLQKLVIRTHLVLPVDPQYRTRLAVDGGTRLLTPDVDHPRGFIISDARTKIHPFPRIPFQLRKDPGYRMRILIDVCTISMATAHPFPGIIPAVLKAMGGRGRYR